MAEEAWRLGCTECGSQYGERDVSYVCPSCAAHQVPGGVTRGILEVVWDATDIELGWGAFLDRTQLTGLERVRPLLPLGETAPALPVLVGDTPMMKAPRLRKALAMPQLWLKDDTRNPSASYKDRASALVCLKAAERGEETIVAASTGNAASALACLSASLGQRAVILVPKSAPRGKLVQMLNHGAQVVPVNGTYDDAFELSLKATEVFGWYNRNTAFNPFTIEGKKTAALEIVRDLGRAPDVILVPTGDGVILSGIAKGFKDLRKAGVIRDLPRLLAVQASGSASIAQAIRDNAELQPVPGAHTVADSICVSAPRAGLLAVREIRESKGDGIIVTDEQILQAIGSLAREGGVFCEPAAAAGYAGLLVGLEEGKILREETVVVMLTGHGLKDIASAGHCVAMPDPIDPTAEALSARMDGVEAHELTQSVSE